MTDASTTTTAGTVQRPSAGLPVDGRPRPPPTPRLWPGPTIPSKSSGRAATLLREHRGDSHVAALLTAGITGRQAPCCTFAAGAVPAAFIKQKPRLRGHRVAAVPETLAARDFTSADGALTDAGRQLKDDIEATTNRAALPALDALDDDEVETLFATLTPITRLVVAGGDVPAGRRWVCAAPSLTTTAHICAEHACSPGQVAVPLHQPIPVRPSAVRTDIQPREVGDRPSSATRRTGACATTCVLTSSSPGYLGNSVLTSKPLGANTSRASAVCSSISRSPSRWT